MRAIRAAWLGRACRGLNGGLNVSRELLRIYHFYMRVLGFELLPELVYRVMGEAGFGPLARLYADATKRYIERYMPGERDPRKLIEAMTSVARAAREAIGEEPLFDFTVSAGENRLVIEAPSPEDGGDGRVGMLRAAVLLGIVAGIIEAAGYKTYVLTRKERASLLPQGSVVLYAEKSGDRVRIVAEYASSAAGSA